MSIRINQIRRGKMENQHSLHNRAESEPTSKGILKPKTPMLEKCWNWNRDETGDNKRNKKNKKEIDELTKYWSEKKH